MDILQIIQNTYPEITNEFLGSRNCPIILRDDSDGMGTYIDQWDYKKPIPKELKLGK